MNNEELNKRFAWVNVVLGYEIFVTPSHTAVGQVEFNLIDTGRKHNVTSIIKPGRFDLTDDEFVEQVILPMINYHKMWKVSNNK